MAKITRKSQKIFGGDLTASGNIGVFGSLKAGSPSYSTDPATIQSSHYNLGWADAVVANNAPALQDMNALFYVDTYQLAYLMQTGIAEWDAGTTYYIGSWCLDSVGTPYCSIVDTNLNNAVTDTTKWRRAILSEPGTSKNYGLTTSVGANALTINLVNIIGATPSASSPVLVSMRSSTAASGLYNLRSSVSALNIVVPSGATLGGTSGVNSYVYVYAIDNAGTLELAVSGTQYNNGSLISTTVLSGSSTSITTIYSSAARSNVPIQMLGRFVVNETTAGLWTSTPSEIAIGSEFIIEATSTSSGLLKANVQSDTGYSAQILNFKASVNGTANLTSTVIAGILGFKNIINVSFLFTYSNANGTPMGSSVRIIIKDTTSGSILYNTGNTVITIPTGYAGPLHRSCTVVVPPPTGTTYTIETYEENSGGGSYTASNGTTSVSVAKTIV